MELTTARPEEAVFTGLDSLATRVSSALISAAPEDFVPAIETALHQIGDLLDVDLTMFLQLPPDGSPAELPFYWARPLNPSADVPASMAAAFIALIQNLGSRPTVLERIPEDLAVEALAGAAVDDMPPMTMKSTVVMPVALPGAFTCVLAVGVLREFRRWPERAVEWLRLMAEMLTAAWHRRGQELALRERSAEIDRLTARLEAESPAVVKPMIETAGVEEIVGSSPALRAAVSRLLEVASSDSNVLLLGETGTGKELFAKVLHTRSSRRPFPLICVNSAALPPTLIESELFGHERGAFTGAVAQRQGRFELAHRGTLFLDEIGDLPLDLQAKLLRVLQEGEFERLGTSRSRKVDVRIIAATHRDLKEEVAEGRFRDDLYYRLNVFPIRVPPLRERLEDVPALVWFLIHKRQRALHRSIKHVPASVMDYLQRYSWPGNIRELENVIERALIHSSSGTLVLLDDDLDAAAVATRDRDTTTLSSIERAHIEDVLRVCGWRINGTGNAAERLGLHPNTLRFRMKKLGIVRQRLPQTP